MLVYDVMDVNKNVVALLHRKIGFINVHAIDLHSSNYSLLDFPNSGEHLEPNSKALRS